MAAPRPVIGYRGWLIGQYGHLLPPHRSRQGHDGTPWKPRSLAIAACSKPTRTPLLKQGFSRRTQPPAHNNHRCGLYGHFKLAEAISKEAPYVHVLGAFVGFGSTVLHSTGLRAGKARIVGLLPLDMYGARMFERIKETAELYEIPLFISHKELEAEAERWGEHREPEHGGLWDAAQISSLAVTAAKLNAESIEASQITRSHFAGLAVGQPTWRAKVKAVVMPSSKVHFTETRNSVTGLSKLEVKGLGSEWLIAGYNINYPIEEVEVPCPPSNRMMRAGSAPPRVELHLEGLFSSEEGMKKALGKLKEVAQIIEQYVSRMR